MEGIFGVGIGEILIVLIAMFVIGGPKNTAKWARQLGLIVRQVREYWAKVMAEIEADLGPDGKELMDAARELGQGARQVSNISPQKRLLSETVNAARSAIDIEANTRDVDARPTNGAAAQAVQTPPPSPDAGETSGPDSKYPAWTPPKNNN